MSSLFKIEKKKLLNQMYLQTKVYTIVKQVGYIVVFSKKT